jgi:replicative DNA helicase
MFDLIGLTQKVASSAHVEYHSQVLLQEYVKRLVIIFNAKITALAYDKKTDIFDLISRWQKEFDKVTDVTQKGRSTIDFATGVDNLRKEIELLSNNTDEVQLVGLTTGFKRIDKHTGGYRNQDLVISAARPGMGKTAKVLKTAVANVSKGVPVGFISLEMSLHQLVSRVVAIDTDFHLGQLLKTGFEHVKYFVSYDEHAKRMKKYPLYIDDSGNNDITDVVLQAKLWVRKYGIKMLIVDYLQLMGDKSIKGNRESEISSISRRLKKLAKELDIPVIALSQLSRAVETRGGSKRPFLSDLRESGSIEQDADIVEFIYRPDYYKREMLEDEYDSKFHKECIRKGANTEIIIAKYRGGSLGTPLLKWVGDKTKFIDVDDDNDTVNYIDNYVEPASIDDAFSVNEKTVFDG